MTKKIDVLGQKILETARRIEAAKSRIGNAKLALRSLRALQEDLILRQRKELEIENGKESG